ncbi:MAG: NUDIX domain-containing protein [Patescibacteria group bacterium]
MKFEFSAGGVVFRKAHSASSGQEEIFILVAQHSQHHGWVFPKGWIEKSETKEDAALREVKEETGIIGRITKPLQPVTYWYDLERVKIKKTVYYFLMEFAGGNTEEHDDEMENVEWMPKKEVLEKLTYKSDKEVWVQAERILATSH